MHFRNPVLDSFDTHHNFRLEELGYVEADGEGDDGDDVLEQPPPQRPGTVEGLVVVCSGGGGGGRSGA